jgi:hypothetical protein
MRNLFLLTTVGILLGASFDSAVAQSMLQRDVYTQREIATQFGAFSAPWGNPLDYEGRAGYVALQRAAPTSPNAEEPSGDIVVHTGR